MKYDSVLDQQSISGKIVSLILCVWKPCYMKSGHICNYTGCYIVHMQDVYCNLLYVRAKNFHDKFFRMIYINDCSIRVVQSDIKIFVQEIFIQILHTKIILQ